MPNYDPQLAHERAWQDPDEGDDRSALEVALDALHIATAYVRGHDKAPSRTFTLQHLLYAVECVRDELEQP